MSKRARGGRALSATAVGYVSPWAVWLLMLPLALVFGVMAGFGQAYAVILGFAMAPAGAALTWQVWHSFGAQSGRTEHERYAATVGFGLAFGWLLAATMFGLFHDPHIALWPEFWNLPRWIGHSFTLPIWFSWFFLTTFCGVAFNITRGAKVKREDGQGKSERETPDELGKILDGATIKVDSIVGKEDAPVIKATMHGVPGKHTGDALMGKAAEMESLHGLRPGAIQPRPDYTDASKAKYTITPVDPLTGDLKWAGPQHPETSIADFPCLVGVYSDGEIIEHWLPGDDDGGRPLQHLAVGGVNGSGKSAGLKVMLTDALTRIDVEVYAADISGKVWQTFGPLMPYLSKVAGLNGIDDSAREQNTLDTLDLIKFAERDAMERQSRWGKAGVNQWSADLAEPFRLLVIEEGAELLESAGEEMVTVARKLRSGGWMIILVAQRFSFDQVPTTLRAQLPARYVFGQNDSRDASMMLPEDVDDIISRSPANSPGAWNSSTPGKALVILPGQARERRSDPARFYWATNAELAGVLAEHGRRLWTDEEIEAMKNDDPPAGILVRTQKQESVGGKRSRTYVQNEDRVRDADVHDSRTYAEDEGDVRTSPTYMNKDGVYVDEEMERTYPVNKDDPIELPEEFDDETVTAPDVYGDGKGLPQDEFRARVQKHLAGLLAEGRQEIYPKDVVALQPPAGSRQRILAELKRLAERGADTDVTVEKVENKAAWLIRAPRSLPVAVS